MVFRVFTVLTLSFSHSYPLHLALPLLAPATRRMYRTKLVFRVWSNRCSERIDQSDQLSSGDGSSPEECLFALAFVKPNQDEECERIPPSPVGIIVLG